MRNSFVFYKDWWQVPEDLPEEERLQAYEAICSYAFDGVVPQNNVIKAVTGLMRTAIDRDNKKFEDKCEKNRKNIRKRWNKDNTTVQNGIHSNTTVQNVIPLDTKHTENENDNENDNYKEIFSTEYTKKGELSLPPKTSLKHKQEQMLARKIEFQNSLGKYLDRNGGEYSADMLNEFFSYWTEPNKSQTKMRFEQQPTWDVSRRLARWEKNNYKYGKGGNS